MSLSKVTLSGLILLYCISSPCLAEMYKYKDAEGRWQFTDKRPQDAQTEIVTKKTTKQSTSSTDLHKTLHDAFKPQTPIEKATLSVVLIKTAMGLGSGFFISNDGYILTNKHVVKPTKTKDWEKSQDQLNNFRKTHRESKRKLDRMAIRLGKMKKELDAYKKKIARETSSNTKRIAQQEYKIYADKYKDRKDEYKKMKQYVAAQKRAYEEARSDFNWKSSMSRAANSFKITLKNDSKLTARLISVSKGHDLALLKIDGHTTPFIPPGTIKDVSQGETVFAVGSPFGLRDSVTSGVVTRIEDKYIMTDTQILPGNSGGPLITKAGKAIGVNTAKLAEFVSAEGFGIAIRINDANEEFKKYLGD